MAKDDFDINFDFDDDLNFDPKSFLGDEEMDDDIDLSQFSDEDLGLKLQDASEAEEAEEDDFDLDIDLDAFLNEDLDEEQESEEEETFTDDVPSFMGRSRTEREEPVYEEPAYEEPVYEEPPCQEPEYQEPEYQEPEYPEQEYQEPEQEVPEQPTEEQEPVKRERRRKTQEKKFQIPKLPPLKTPNIFTKFFDLYFAPVLHKELRESPQDPKNPRRRRRKSKAQIFKEVYLPPIVVCVTLILVLSFAIGSLSNALEQRRLDKDTEQSRLDESKSAQEQVEANAQAAMVEAERLANSYDYEAAIKVLDSFLNSVEDKTPYSEMTNKRSSYVTEQASLLEYRDASLIPNLSFHVLINDMARAMQDTDDLKGSYNRNFVSTAEFTKILQELYNNNYVLVDFDSFTTYNDGTMYPEPVIKLPDNKKPIMITETMVNYLGYMVDSDKDWVADSGGDGFASKLVLDANGDIKAEYVDSSGNTSVGDYDLVPILETFIKEHPDFSYKGARATLAVCGYEGIFGYRINTSFIADKSQTFQEQEVAGAKKIVQALRDKGYTLACYSYGNEDYKKINANQITSDLQLWTQQITPVIGDVNVFVFARESDITDYGGNAFNVLYTSGFRYFVSNAKSPSTEINTTYVRQKRLMVTGHNMAWQQDMFTGIFDPNTVIDMTSRGGSVPTG